MTALSSKELARMRADLAHLLPDTAVIYTDAGTMLNSVLKHDWEISGTINCRVDYQSGHSYVDAQTTRDYSDLRLTCVYDEPLTTANVIEFDSVRYRVLSVSPPSAWNIHKIVRLEPYE